MDFENTGDPTFPVCGVDSNGNIAGLFGVFNDHVFTQDERDKIQTKIKADYDAFKFSFMQQDPSSITSEFTTISFTDNDAPLSCLESSNVRIVQGGGISVLFGEADGIDFGNRDKKNEAFADVSVWEFLSQFLDGRFFESFSNIDVAGDFGVDLNAAKSFAIVRQAANTCAHELGHTLGLRHQNSFGAPGDGIPSTGAISPFDFVPVFDGPSNADETILHTMASGASVGLPFDGGVNMDRFFSERSAARLAINQKIDQVTESEEALLDGVLNLKRLYVPNTIVEGENADAFIKVSAKVVEGSISTFGEADSFIITARKGEFINAELVPGFATGQTFEDGIVGKIQVFSINRDDTEELIGSNSRSFESPLGTEVFDIVAPQNGQYRIEVSVPNEFFFDFNGEINRIPLSALRNGALLTGNYSLLAFTCRKRLRG